MSEWRTYDGDNEDERRSKMVFKVNIAAYRPTYTLLHKHTHAQMLPPFVILPQRHKDEGALPLQTCRLVIQTTSQTNLVAAAFDSSFSTICCQIPGEVLFSALALKHQHCWQAKTIRAN